MDKHIPDERWRRLCKSYYDRLIEPLRITARFAGYALAVHGSLQRDIDLIACPWGDSVEARVLAERLRVTAEAVVGYAQSHELGKDKYGLNGSPGSKDYGRLVWSFYLGGGPYIDLSVMPMRDLEYIIQ
jgi:hypothetical protein